MYHSISDEPETGHPYYWINTSPKRFAEHIQFLHDNNYKVISLSDAVRIIKSATNHPITLSPYPPIKYVVLTFDDGYQDFYTEAFPILKEYEFNATVFLATGFISDGALWFKGKRCLTWGEIWELAGLGFRFGSHTITHPNLKSLNWDQIEREIGESRETIEERIGSRVESFSYPYAFPEGDGFFKMRIKTALTKLGFTSGVTTIVGTVIENDDPLLLKRIPVNSDDDLIFLEAKLEGRYDWVRSLQCGWKLLRGNRKRNRTRAREHIGIQSVL